MSRCVALLGLLAAASGGCSPADVVVAQQAARDGGGRVCATTNDCPPAAYCALPGCGASLGECTLRPVACPSAESEVCGCDGAIYWNDCLRQRDGVESATPGFCDTIFTTCGGPQDGPCPVPDAVCGHVSPGGPGGCGGPSGVCWVLPDTCPVDAGGPPLASCSMPPACTDLCTALRSGSPYARANPGECP